MYQHYPFKGLREVAFFVVFGVALLFGIAAFSSESDAAKSKGPLQVSPEYPAWLLYGDGSPFFMCGPGDPEGFLYRGKGKHDGTREGDQLALINKMAGTGANCIYLMALRSHGGDGGSEENPFVDNDINQPLNEAVLDQWEQWFTEMNKKGIVIFLFLYDDSSAPFPRDLIQGELHPREAYFVDTIVSRFKHHPYLIWCVAEEYAEALSAARVSKIAERIKSRDDYQHPVAVHQNHGTSFDFSEDPRIDQFAMQYNAKSPEELHDAAVVAWHDSGGKKNINLSEFQPRPTGEALRKTVWSIVFGGAYSMILFMDIENTTEEDLRICGDLVSFMESVRFHETAPADDLARGTSRYVLAKPGLLYLVYQEKGNQPGLLLEEGCYALHWYDIARKEWIHAGKECYPSGEHYFEKPDRTGDQCVLYLVSFTP
ncbi:MAG: DUF4038 domain-containing protein [Candidatus Hydrogenedens sp.]|nr:DUF4038 domain-containing protein [Candidatus Hydrogenedens sp.]